MGRTYCCLKTISVHNMFYPCFAKRKASDKEEFYNILSDCHYFDVINSLLNAFRLKKKIWQRFTCTVANTQPIIKIVLNFFWTFLFNVRCIWKNWLQYEKVFIKICWPYEKILWRFCQNFKEIEKKWNSSQQACSAGSEVGVLTNKLRKWHEWALWGVKCLNFWGLNQLYSMTSYLSALFFLQFSSLKYPVWNIQFDELDVSIKL